MKVAQHHDRLSRLNATAVFVAYDDPDVLQRTMLHGVSSPFPVLVDSMRGSYRTWGLDRASFARVWLDPAVWIRYAQLIAGGERVRGLGSDTRQLGGDFIVNPAGVLIYSRPQQRDDRPPVGHLLRIIEQESPDEG